MKLKPGDMAVLDLDYGDLVRPDYRILNGRGWGQCTNSTGEILIVYGPKHTSDMSVCDTTPYVLPSGATTPDNWDCDGFLLPSDRLIRLWRGTRGGPLAIKFRDFRGFTVRRIGPAIYQAPWNNGVFEPSQINWAIPNLSYDLICRRLEKSRNTSDMRA
jgi:hypothetical protein